MVILQSCSTPLHPCGLEVVVVGDKRYLVCGCYELDEGTQTRDGCLQIYHINDDLTIVPCERFSCPAGVLDFKVDGAYIAVALSNGLTIVYKLTGADPLRCEVVLEYEKEDEGLFLSVDFTSLNNSLSSDSGSKLCISSQASSIMVCDISPSGLQMVEHKTNTHCLLGEPMPVWTVAMDKYHDRNRLASGGDDSIFRLWDLRCEAAVARSKFHTAGVTAIQWHAGYENIFLTGSYDEQCAVWDVRNLIKPLHTVNTGGGVWRAKWTDLNDHLVSCYADCIVTTAMQAGCSLHRVAGLQAHNAGDKGAIEVVSCAFSDHQPKQLIYDVKVVNAPSRFRAEGEHLVMACCSFYDSLLYLVSMDQQ